MTELMEEYEAFKKLYYDVEEQCSVEELAEEYLQDHAGYENQSIEVIEAVKKAFTAGYVYAFHELCQEQEDFHDC